MRVWFRHSTLLDVSPHFKPERRDPAAAGLQQYSYAVPRLVSRLGSAIWSDMDMSAHCFRVIRTSYDLFLLVAVAPINVLAGTTDDCLLHVCTVVTVVLQL